MSWETMKSRMDVINGRLTNLEEGIEKMKD